MLKKMLNFLVPIICITVGIWIGMHIKNYQIQTENSQQAPRKSLTVNNIDEKNRRMVFDTLTTFAEDNAFAIRIATLSPGNEIDSTIFSMWRSDVNIGGQEVGAFPGILKIGFYDTERLYKAPEWIYNDLVDELISHLEEIPNIQVEIDK